MPSPRSFEFGPYRLSTETSVLWRGDAIVPLTPKALAFLRVLVEHKGDVVTKSQLMSRVWTDTVVEEGNLSVTVAALRKALDPQPDGRSYIQTVARRGYRFDAPIQPSGEPLRLALAVLPFTCLGPGTEAHLGLALADAIIERLTAHESLLVRPTMAVAHYAEIAAGPREAAKELGVDAVVAGTVQREQSRVRVSVQLVPRPAALRPWAQSFDTDWTDLFAVLDTIAERVTGALWPRLFAGAPPGARVRQTPRPEALESYLRGRFFWARFDPKSLGRAFAYFGEAAALDPGYGAARGGLADAHLLLGLAGLSSPPQAWDLAEACAREALALDPTLTEAHLSLGYAALFRDWNWAGARQAVDHALRQSPGLVSTHLWRGLFLLLCGDLAEAQRAIGHCLRLDPLSGVASALQCSLYELAGEYGLAQALARQAVGLRPDGFLGYRSLGLASARLGQTGPAQEALAHAVELVDGLPGVSTLLAWACAHGGQAEPARQRLAELDERAASVFVSPCQRGAVLAALGETEAALDSLEQGVALRDAQVVFLGSDPLYAPLRAEPRFQALWARIGGPVRPHQE